MVGGGVELIGVQCGQRDVDGPAGEVGEVGEDRGVGGEGLDNPGSGLGGQGGGVVGISGIWDRQRSQHGHQPLARLHLLLAENYPLFRTHLLPALEELRSGKGAR